jgi:hypothetical protein
METQGTLEYQELAKRCLATLEKTEALTESEPDRRKIDSGDYKFKP